jgi:pimeloyl-ACP methyl ester carboxylesterase
VATVVLLHALPLDERMWDPQRDLVPGIVTPNLYALGGSAMDTWAERMLEQVGGDLVLVGASMGGYCALAAVRRAPERVRGLVLAGSRADPDSPERRAGRADTIRLVREEGVEALWESMRPKLFPADADLALVERARRIAVEQEPDAVVRAVEAIRERGDATDVVAELGDRALVVLGERDPFVSAEEVRAHEVHVLPGCGHLPSMERATEFNELLEGALERWM